MWRWLTETCHQWCLPSQCIFFFLDGKVVLLVLNSLYWSKAVNRSVETDQKASKQLVWLENQLKLVKSHGQKAMLASHIPAGWDTLELMPGYFYGIFLLFAILTSPKSESLVDDDLFFFSLIFSIDTFSSKPYWFNNYTDIYVRLVAKNYSDVVIGMSCSL